MNDNFTLDALLDSINKISTTFYYATSDMIELGSVVIVKNDHTAYPSFPKYFVSHPDDLEQLKEDNPTITFIHLSRAPLQFSYPLPRYKSRWVP